MANINGTNKGGRIRGAAQNDRIDGRQGDDTLFGGAGDDILLGGVGRDRLYGEEGDDYLDGGNGGDELTGGAGNDRIVGGNAGDVAIFSGLSTDYRVEVGPLQDSYIVTDLRPGSPDGTDLVSGISLVGFVDGSFDPDDLVGRTPPNSAPVANADAVMAAEDGATTLNVLANDSDADDDAVSVVSLDLTGASGSASINPDGTLSYTPTAAAQALQAGLTMTDSFTYTIADSNGLTSTATVTVTVAGAADTPVAADDELTLAEDAGAVNVTDQLLGNDTDIDAGDTRQVTAVQAVSERGASVSATADGQVVYNSGAVFAYLQDGESATDSFTYTITDSTGLTSTATATVTITGVSQEADAYFYVQEDGTNAQMWGSIVESFGFDIVGVDTAGTLGTVEYDYEAGLLSFTADHESSDILNFDGQQMAYFTVIGDEGERKVIGMVIEGNNDAIVAVDDAVAIEEGGASGNLWQTLIGNDLDVDSFFFEILSVDTSATQGNVVFDPASRTLTYSAAGIDLASGETIADSFSYVVEDGHGSTDVATVTVTVTGTEDGSASVVVTRSSAQAGPAFGAASGSAFLADGAPESAFAGMERLSLAEPASLAGPECQFA